MSRIMQTKERYRDANAAAEVLRKQYSVDALKQAFMDRTLDDRFLHIGQIALSNRPLIDETRVIWEGYGVAVRVRPDYLEAY